MRIDAGNTRKINDKSCPQDNWEPAQRRCAAHDYRHDSPLALLYKQFCPRREQANVIKLRLVFGPSRGRRSRSKARFTRCLLVERPEPLGSRPTGNASERGEIPALFFVLFVESAVHGHLRVSRQRRNVTSGNAPPDEGRSLCASLRSSH